MINKIQKYIINKNLFSKENYLLLAISGGADSMALFFSLQDLGYNFEVAHCNFNLRGKESDEDEFFVKNLANQHGVKCHVKSFDTQKYANSNKVSIQMAARELRYTWFEELLVVNNLDFIISAHHKNDNIETFFINLIRGTGINGLCGMKSISRNIIRPLLEVNRQEIDFYLMKRGIAYRNDSSNGDVKYLRNKIRHQLIPLLTEINPNIEKTISDEINILNGINTIFQKKINEIRSDLVVENKGVYRLTISQLIEYKNLEIILFEILRPFGFFEVNQIIKAISSQSGKQFFSETHQLVIDRKQIIVFLLEDCKKDIDILEVETYIKLPFNMRFKISKDISVQKNLNVARFDFDKITFPLKLRKWQAGDRFKPLGMNNFKKVSDFFIDEKYSILDKKKQWILCSGNDILWIVGNRIDDRYKIDTNTKKVYIAELLHED